MIIIIWTDNTPFSIFENDYLVDWSHYTLSFQFSFFRRKLHVQQLENRRTRSTIIPNKKKPLSATIQTPNRRADFPTFPRTSEKLSAPILAGAANWWRHIWFLMAAVNCVGCPLLPADWRHVSDINARPLGPIRAFDHSSGHVRFAGKSRAPENGRFFRPAAGRRSRLVF